MIPIVFILHINVVILAIFEVILIYSASQI